MNHETYLAEKRNELVNVAMSVLSGDMNLIEGIRKMNSLRFEIEDSDNDVFLFIRGVESETDQFPIGLMRSYCHMDYLHRMDAEMEDYLAKARESIFQSCREIIQRYS